jgi:hypothetical protein
MKVKNWWMRLGVVAGVLVVFVYAASTLAVNIANKDTLSCKKLQSVCSRSCADSPYTGFGLCQEGTHGATSPVSVQCCCCTDGWEHRYFIGG